jgi:curved DNA-binding protein CbpA
MGAALLGVAADAPAAEVQRAYLRAARRTHPDLLQEADEGSRRAASDAFVRLTRARDALLAEQVLDPLERARWTRGPEGEDGPAYRPVPGRGIGGSLVVLALLAFLLVAIVTAEQSFQGTLFSPGSTSSTVP